jgi:hypothetical protein
VGGADIEPACSQKGDEVTMLRFDTDKKLLLNGIKLERGERSRARIPVLEFADGALLELTFMVLI